MKNPNWWKEYRDEDDGLGCFRAIAFCLEVYAVIGAVLLVILGVAHLMR